MSLINQMLQDLEQRRADGGTPAAQVRAVSRLTRSNVTLRWVAMALIVAIAAAGGGYWLANRQSGHSLGAPAPAPLVMPPVAAPVPVAEPAPVPLSSVLQMDSQLSQLPVPSEKPVKPMLPPVQATIPAAISAPPPSADKPARATKELPPAEFNKEIKQTSPQQRAENAYRQAYASLQQGRMGEAEEGLRQVLQIDPRHAAARQGLAALLVESKHLDRAEQVLQQGLELQPGHTGYAMTLARVQVERGDVAAALATLQRNPPNAENAEYHGFLAALLQRAERHKEAIEHYQSALNLNPAAGQWLLGLGISLQADNQTAKAAEIFRRAKQSNISPELKAFAEQRLKQVQ